MDRERRKFGDRDKKFFKDLFRCFFLNTEDLEGEVLVVLRLRLNFGRTLIDEVILF